MSAPTPSVEKFVTVAPFAVGDDVSVDLAGPSAATGWALEVKAALTQTGTPLAAPGVTAAYVGGADFTIRLTLPRAFTSTLSVGGSREYGELFVELRRTDAGNYTLLRRLRIPYFARIS